MTNENVSTNFLKLSPEKFEKLNRKKYTITKEPSDFDFINEMEIKQKNTYHKIVSLFAIKKIINILKEK